MKKIILILLALLIPLSIFACGGNDSDNDEPSDKPLVMTSLFPQYDMARHIGGDYVDVEFLLPPGVDPHGFEPTARKIIEIMNADMLIYTGDSMEPWVPRLIADYDAEHLKILDLSKNVERIGLFQADQDFGGTNDDSDDDFDGEIETVIDTFEIYGYQTDASMFAYVHDDHWHGALPNVGVDQVIALSADIIDNNQIERPLDALENELGIALAEGAPEGVVALENHGDHIRIKGLKTGITMIEFHWIYEGQVRYKTPPINIQVRETVEEDDSFYDPHIWLDPLNAIQMVRDIRDAFIAMAPEHEAAFQANAQDYIDNLNDIHRDYLNLAEHRGTNVMMHGGHNAFGYFANRYDVQYLTPYRGFSTDAEPTSGAIANMINLMNEHSINHLFTEIGIAPNVAQAISEETNAEILMLYSAENAPADDLNAGITFIDMLYHNLEQFKIGMQYDQTD